jgi:hypothetical protein
MIVSKTTEDSQDQVHQSIGEEEAVQHVRVEC